MSTNYVIDSWAWIEYLRGTAAGEVVRAHVKKDTLFTCAVTIAEVISKAQREGSDEKIAFEAITSLSKIIHVNEINAREVGQVHATIKANNKNFSLADAFVLQGARNLRAKVLTGDPDFKGMKEAEMLK